MHKNAIWIAFLLIVVGFALWFIVKAGYDLIHYYQLNTQVPVTVEKWETRELAENKYALYVAFTYEFQGKNYGGADQIGEAYPNPWAAARAQDRLGKEKWFVWISPKNPEMGVLNKKFPYKAGVSAVVLLGLVIYFICVGLYVGVKYEQRK